MNGEKTNTLHPISRILFLTGSVIAILLMHHVFYLLLFYLVFILPLIFAQKNIFAHLRLLAFGIVPIVLTFILLYILIMKGSNGGWEFIFLKSLKILCITSVFQITLSIPAQLLIPTFKKWGLKGEGLLTVIGAFTVWAEVKTKSNQIITARFARGFIGKRNLINTAKQLPHVLIPLIIGVMRTAVERVDVWEQREIPVLLDKVETSKVKYSIGLSLMAACAPWVVSVVLVLVNLN